MKLSHKEVELLLNTINPTVEYYRDINARTYGELVSLQDRLEQYINVRRIKSVSIDSNGYYMGDNLTPKQEQHNQDIDAQIQGEQYETNN